MQPWARKQIEAALKDIPKKRGRCNSTKHEADGYTFDSSFELLVYEENKLDPDIEIIQLHPAFPLIPEFSIDRKVFRESIYTADQLIYVHSRDQNEVIEIKSSGTEKMTDYRLRKRLFLFLYPDVIFREIIFDRKGKTTTRIEKIYGPRTRSGRPGSFGRMPETHSPLREHEPVPGRAAED